MSETAGAEPPVERQVWLVRHGETEWARLGRHTGRTDIPLTDVGRSQAGLLGRRIGDHPFALVLTSPLSRAAETAAIAGFPDAERDPDLQEWDYGALEGRTTPDIRSELADWTIWTGPWPAGETPDEVGARADRVIARCLDPGVDGDVAAVRPRPSAADPGRSLAASAAHVRLDVRARDGDDRDPGLGPGQPGHRVVERGLPPHRRLTGIRPPAGPAARAPRRHRRAGPTRRRRRGTRRPTRARR